MDRQTDRQKDRERHTYLNPEGSPHYLVVQHTIVDKQGIVTLRYSLNKEFIGSESLDQKVRYLYRTWFSLLPLHSTMLGW